MSTWPGRQLAGACACRSWTGWLSYSPTGSVLAHGTSPTGGSMSDTRSKLLGGAVQTIRSHGIAGVSARTVAAAAGVNQALVFYHFGNLDALLAEACLTATRQRLETYRKGLAKLDSFRELLEFGRD